MRTRTLTEQPYPFIALPVCGAAKYTEVQGNMEGIGVGTEKWDAEI
jgi:hypothetical protein